jgi:hypothetical protein
MKKLTKKQVGNYIRKHWATKTKEEIALYLGMPPSTVYDWARRMKLPQKRNIEKTYTIPEQLEQDKKKISDKGEEAVLKQKLKFMLEENHSLRNELRSTKAISPISTYDIPIYKSSGGNEGTIVFVASDWHLGETVKREEVNGLNEYSPSIARKRAEQFFQNTMRVAQILGKDIPIKHCILALIGDFINNMMFEEAMESNSMLPIKEVIFAQDIIASGIEYYLKNSDYDFTIVCHSGNHGRATKKPRNGENEAGHSFEYLLYQNLAQYFKNEKRVTFIIPESYMSYVKVYDQTICFHHGHNIRYMGGIGGLTIPMMKAIAQWENARRADLYICGHFHQLFDGGTFVVNGSMVGFNGYAIAIKAKYEKPMQMVLLLDKKRGRTMTSRISFDV